MIETAPLPVVGLLLLAAMTSAWFIAFALQRRYGASDARDAHESYVLSGVFGLLALLLAFAFSLAIGRYETRRELVVAEANSIGTMATRFALLDEAAAAPLRRDLAAYARTRTAAGETIGDTQWDAASAASGAACDRLGGRLMAVLRAAPPDTRGPVLVQAYNEMCDVATARHAARKARLPGEVLGLLALYCCAGAGMLGYTLGSTGRRHAPASLLFFALLAAAFVTILDLDRPRGGAILVPQEELEAVATKLAG